MVARMWRGWAGADVADEIASHLRESRSRATTRRRERVDLGPRPTLAGGVELVTLTVWDSGDAVGGRRRGSSAPRCQADDRRPVGGRWSAPGRRPRGVIRSRRRSRARRPSEPEDRAGRVGDDRDRGRRPRARRCRRSPPSGELRRADARPARHPRARGRGHARSRPPARVRAAGGPPHRGGCREDRRQAADGRGRLPAQRPDRRVERIVPGRRPCPPRAARGSSVARRRAGAAIAAPSNQVSSGFASPSPRRPLARPLLTQPARSGHANDGAGEADADRSTLAWLDGRSASPRSQPRGGS
jgi:hypothetical protein